MKLRNKSLVRKLLQKNISKSQFFGYSFANLIGLTVILAGILFYSDSHHQLKKDDKFFSDDYIVISKKVKGINLEPVSFTEDEIEDISKQPGIKKLGKFTSADFTVSASLQMGGKGMSSYLFFESVPDDFFDNIPEGWTFQSDSKFIPIVLNKDYLALYNFGFALPQGLPQLSEEMIGTLPLRLMIRGENGVVDIFDAGVVGFSSRLNTIAVPQEFMDWANERYSTKKETEISRLILKIDRLDSRDFQNYLSSNGYEIAGDKENDSKMSQFMALISGLTTLTGLIISLLSLFILLLSVSLLIQKSHRVLRNLILLGYAPDEPAHFYNITIICVNGTITAIAVGLTFLCRLIWHKPLINLGLGNGNVLFMLGAALLFFILTTLINFFVIRHHLYSVWHNNQ